MPAFASGSVPMDWGIDEDTGILLRIEDYDFSPVVTDSGRLSINDGGVTQPFPDTALDRDDVFSNLESLALDKQRFAYAVGMSLSGRVAIRRIRGLLSHDRA